jgi:hypothetical protein
MREEKPAILAASRAHYERVGERRFLAESQIGWGAEFSAQSNQFRLALYFDLTNQTI